MGCRSCTLGIASVRLLDRRYGSDVGSQVNLLGYVCTYFFGGGAEGGGGGGAGARGAGVTPKPGLGMRGGGVTPLVIGTDVDGGGGRSLDILPTFTAAKVNVEIKANGNDQSAMELIMFARRGSSATSS
jgi:hypothetical protein